MKLPTWLRRRRQNTVGTLIDLLADSNPLPHLRTSISYVREPGLQPLVAVIAVEDVAGQLTVAQGQIQIDPELLAVADLPRVARLVNEALLADVANQRAQRAGAMSGQVMPVGGGR